MKYNVWECRFARSSVNFHAEDGSGYKFFADMVMKVHTPHSCRQSAAILTPLQL